VSFEPPSVKIHQQVLSVGEFPKKGIYKNGLHFTACPETPLGGRICTKFGTAAVVTDDHL